MPCKGVHELVKGRFYFWNERYSVFWFCAGAIKLHTPLLMPRNKKLYEHNEASYFMDHSGMLVMLPYDLRVSNIISSHKVCRRFEGSCGGIWFKLTLLLTAEVMYLSVSLLVLLSSVLLLLTAGALTTYWRNSLCLFVCLI